MFRSFKKFEYRIWLIRIKLSQYEELLVPPNDIAKSRRLLHEATKTLKEKNQSIEHNNPKGSLRWGDFH